MPQLGKKGPPGEAAVCSWVCVTKTAPFQQEQNMAATMGMVAAMFVG
ncbi:MAG TPA: hypothetical protein H9710_00550 [Candidatus Acutalibacter pullicola]|uniref:Uncharacterized protein n=1 Tax=Candidatus Acutalibacter pullicola TaxID=2838417 RepID=A0A9D2MTC5_9FIRM|nr:hypothetical protein [Candidatus Acutalibacter pullicola]